MYVLQCCSSAARATLLLWYCPNVHSSTMRVSVLSNRECVVKSCASNGLGVSLLPLQLHDTYLDDEPPAEADSTNRLFSIWETVLEARSDEWKERECARCIS